MALNSLSSPAAGEALLSGGRSDRHETNDRSEARIGLRVAMGSAEAAADGYIETLQLVVMRIDDGNQPDVVGEDINIVVGWNGDADLEFARQVTVLVKRVFFLFFIRYLFFVQPDLVVCSTGLWAVVAKS